MTAFVGRVEELAALAGIEGAAVRGKVAAAIVMGDPGTGKSRLLAEAAARSDLLQQFRVVGYEPERDVPLAAASEFLRALTDATHGRRLEALLFDDDPKRASPLEPIRIFEAAHRALRTVGPGLVLVDDLQWVDDISRALCHYLVRAAEASGDPLALIAVARHSPSAASFADSLGQLLPRESVLRLELGPLSDHEAFELVKELAPTLGDDSARALVDRSGRSPFWIEALARSAGAEIDAGGFVTARLHGAGADAGALLALLAIAARPLALADAAELSGWAEDHAEQAARELVVRGIAVESAGVLRLAHDLIRAAAVRELPEEQRVRIHRRVSDWLVRGAGDDVRRLREALGHRNAGGLPSLELANRLARSPQRTLLGEDGLALLVTIADAADSFDEVGLELNEEIAALATALGRHGVALERRLMVAERHHDPLRRTRALLEAAKSAFALDEIDRARAYLDRARVFESSDEILGLELDVEQATLDLWSDGRKERGRVLAHETARCALRLFEVDKRARRPYLDALRVEYEAAYQEDDAETMVRVAEDRAAAARAFDEEVYLTALLSSARGLRRMGRLNEALERAQRVHDESRQRVLPRLELDAGYWLGTILLQSGRVTDAEDVAAAAAELAWRVGDEARGRHRIERLASEVAYYGGDWRSGVDRLLDYARGGTEHARVELHQLAALWIAFAGGQELAHEVLAYVASARACADGAGCPRCATELRLAASDALAHVGQQGDAAQSLAEWVQMQARPQPRDGYVRRRVEALLREPVSVELLDAAACEAEELGFGLDALWTRLDLASALVATDPARAKDVLAAAAELADQWGAKTVSEVAAKRLRSLGVRTWRRGAGRGAALTDRERAIAQLIAEGATNPEIARQLFLSRKTVERHVSNVLKKAGARNRAELAAKVAELEVEGAHG
jgi:DNA-binding CsgD family transcriptional regulator